MDYISSQSTFQNDTNTIILNNLETGVKINEFLMNDQNFSVNFEFQFDKSINEVIELDQIKNIELKDLIVIDEENRIIFSMATKETFDEYCKKNNLPYNFNEFNENYINNGLNRFIRSSDITTNQISLNYNIYTENKFPKSKKLRFDFGNIILERTNENESDKNVIISGDWSINVDVPAKMYNREDITYKVVNCTNNNFNITAALATETGFEIGIIINNIEKPPYYLQLVNEEIREEINKGIITEEETNERRNELLRTPKYQNLLAQLDPIQDTPCSELENMSIENTSYIENEKFEKFEKSLSPTRKQENNFIDNNKFSYYETFELTKYDITDKLKLQIMFKEEPVIIELERN